jgi:hypothetical protein
VKYETEITDTAFPLCVDYTRFVERTRVKSGLLSHSPESRGRLTHEIEADVYRCFNSLEFVAVLEYASKHVVAERVKLLCSVFLHRRSHGDMGSLLLSES